MFRKALVLLTIVALAYLTGCASVPMASLEEDKSRKEFTYPSPAVAGLYIYRNSAFGGALKKTVYIDGEVIGETAPKTYFYLDIQPGKHELSTESEFSDNILAFNAKGGENYYVRNYIKMGFFVGGANLKLVSEEEGREGVLECKLANMQTNNLLTTIPKTDEMVKMAPTKTPNIVSEPISGEGVSVFDYYGEAEEEINTKSYDKNLWAKALVEAEGDEQKRKAKYIELRGNQLYSENVGSISNLNEQPLHDIDVSDIGISGTYVSDISGPSWAISDKKLMVTFKQSGNDIIGTNVSQAKIITGTRNGNTIKFQYISGITGVWEVNPDGTKLEGSWDEPSGGNGKWNLTRIE